MSQLAGGALGCALSHRQDWAMEQDAMREAILEAAALIRAETRSPAWTLFDELVPREGVHTPRAQHAVGAIEGAALALGLTPIELMDECGVEGES